MAVNYEIEIQRKNVFGHHELQVVINRFRVLGLLTYYDEILTIHVNWWNPGKFDWKKHLKNGERKYDDKWPKSKPEAQNN